jgi:hypothetical protein
MIKRKTTALFAAVTTVVAVGAGFAMVQPGEPTSRQTLIERVTKGGALARARQGVGVRELDPRASICGGGTLGEVALLRPGYSAQSLQAAGAAEGSGATLPVAIKDQGLGSMVLYQPSAVAATQLSQSTYAAKPVLAQSTNPLLRSCEMTLSDRPAARAVLATALQALKSASLLPETHGQAAPVKQMLVSDNPLKSSSLIVTLLFPGDPQQPSAAGAPVTYTLTPFTVVMDYPSLQVTGTAASGL